MGDTINRQEAVDALWKALFDYEDKTEKQFIESDELDVGDWIVHRGFVQNMSDIDRQTILNLPSAQPEIVRCKDCKHRKFVDFGMGDCLHPSGCRGIAFDNHFCALGERRDRHGRDDAAAEQPDHR